MHSQILSPWLTSSHSTAQSNCVAVAEIQGGRAVRDSQNPEEGHLSFPKGEWLSLLNHCKSPNASSAR